MTARILDGRAMARALRMDVPDGIHPHLASVQVGDDEATSQYVASQAQRFEEAGIRFTLHRLGSDATREGVGSLVTALNEDPAVTGIMVHLPLPPGMPAAQVHSLIRPEKDVEGMTPANLGALVQESPVIIPCTALAAYLMIRSSGIPLRGKEAVVVGHSPLVGKPIATLLVNDLATVTTCHIGTEDLPSHTRRAEILVAATGVEGLIRGSMIRPGAVVIDVGVSLGGGSGDVVFEEAREVAGYITPVPGGVGPVTVATLLRNTIRAAALSAGIPAPPLLPSIDSPGP